MTRLSRTRTHPTRLFMQLLRWAANEASLIKYWSQDGRSRSSLTRFNLPRSSCSTCMDGAELMRRTSARSINLARPDVGLYKCWSLIFTKSSRSGIGSSRRSHLALNRSHLRPIGASTLIKRKKGLLERLSRTSSSHISVMTQRCRHSLVTKSSSSSTLEKMCDLLENCEVASKDLWVTTVSVFGWR